VKAGALLRLCAFLVLCIFTAAPAAAKCLTRDAWTGYDKNQHFAIGAAFGMGGTLHAGNRWHGFALGAGVGLLKELADSDGRGTCSLQDAAVTILGAAVGAQLGGVMFEFQRGRVGVRYHTTF